MTTQVVLTALGLASTLVGVLFGSRLQHRNSLRQWRAEATRQAVVSFIRVAGRLQLAILDIARASGGAGHCEAVAAVDAALVELNVEAQALELTTPWELSGKFWSNLGQIEASLAPLRAPGGVRHSLERDAGALEGSSEVSIWLQGCIREARRHLGYSASDDFG